jgi:hypothetical protein
LSVTNIGDQAQSNFESNQRLTDTAGRQYEANTPRLIYGPTKGRATSIPVTRSRRRRRLTYRLGHSLPSWKFTIRSSPAARRFNTDGCQS